VLVSWLLAIGGGFVLAALVSYILLVGGWLGLIALALAGWAFLIVRLRFIWRE
jgi:hypothetical protein